MKKIALLLFSLCLICSCNRDKDDNYDIKYDGSNSIEIVLREKLKIDATSDEPIQYYSDNELANDLKHFFNIGCCWSVMTFNEIVVNHIIFV